MIDMSIYMSHQQYITNYKDLTTTQYAVEKTFTLFPVFFPNFYSFDQNNLWCYGAVASWVQFILDPDPGGKKVPDPDPGGKKVPDPDPHSTIRIFGTSLASPYFLKASANRTTWSVKPEK